MLAKKNLMDRAENKSNSNFLKIDVTGPFSLVFQTPHESGFFMWGLMAPLQAIRVNKVIFNITQLLMILGRIYDMP